MNKYKTPCNCAKISYFFINFSKIVKFSLSEQENVTDFIILTAMDHIICMFLNVQEKLIRLNFIIIVYIHY